ncbi:OVARIAN TUMOR DOMAIN-containing deubiquitinating enzyme 3 [Citrus sinensis]|nr:OVARIAN TUMOR DOMAIN-containing deubiquitinating enzyme 3 [Citrus sinensis]
MINAEGILEQLRLGVAKFELVSSPVASISNPNSQTFPTAFHRDSNNLFFARIGPPLGGGSPAMKKVERYSVQRVTGDGRCLFRALVKGMALNKGITLNSRDEREDADDLRMAVKEVICDSGSERRQYEEALIAITIDESLKRYCQRIGRSDFWGGESELLVLSKLCSQPIVVYIPEHEHRGGGGGSGFIPIADRPDSFTNACVIYCYSFAKIGIALLSLNKPALTKNGSETPVVLPARCPHLSVCPSSPPFSGSGSPSRDSNRCIVANVGTYVSFNGSGKSVTVAILCSVKSIAAAILCSRKSVTAAILCSGNSVTAVVLWDRVPAFWGTGIGSVYTSGRYIPLTGVPLWSVYACQGFPSGRFMLVPVFGSYHRLR